MEIKPNERNNITVDEFDSEEDSYYKADFLSEGRPYSEARREIFLNKEQYSVNFINDLIKSDVLDLNPEFQRKTVWNDPIKKSLFIESLLLNIPIPIFYAYDAGDSQLSIIDGKQRLTTIKDFLENKFVLKKIKYLKEFEGKTFDELPERVKIEFNRYQCQFYILHHATPKRYLFDIFMRINTGGESLTSQEIRNAFAKPKVRQLLLELSKSTPFLTVTNSKVNDNRMESQELVLRYIALLNCYDFKKSVLIVKESSLSQLLENTIAELNNMDDYSFYKEKFTDACKRSLELFGKDAFHRPKYSNGKVKITNKFNKSLFAATMVLLSNPSYEMISLGQYKEKVMEELAYYFSNAGAYSSGTGNKNTVVHFFDAIDYVFKESIKYD